MIVETHSTGYRRFTIGGASFRAVRLNGQWEVFEVLPNGETRDVGISDLSEDASAERIWEEANR